MPIVQMGNDKSVTTNMRVNVLAFVGQLEQTEVQQLILPFGTASLPNANQTVVTEDMVHNMETC